MRLGCKWISLTIIVVGFLIPSIANATLTDLQWRVSEGNEIEYTFRGQYYDWDDTKVTFEEDMYFVVDDLTGIPIPGLSGVFTDGGAAAVTPFWINDSSFDDEGWFTNIGIIDSIVVRVGNWSLYTDLTYQFIDSQNELYSWIEPPIEPYAVILNETLKVWNVTVTRHLPSGGVPYLQSISSFSYSKSDGVLNYGAHHYFSGNKTNILAITRIDDQSNLSFELVIGAATIIAVLVIIILVKRRR